MRTSQRGCLPHHEQVAHAADTEVCIAISYAHCGAGGAEFLLSASSSRAGAAPGPQLLVTASDVAFCFYSLPSSFTKYSVVTQPVPGAGTPGWAFRSSDRTGLDQDAHKSTGLLAAPRAAGRCGGRSNIQSDITDVLWSPCRRVLSERQHTPGWGSTPHRCPGVSPL